MNFRPLREFANWLMALFRRDSMQDEFDAEMQQHIDFMIDELVGDGMSPDEARKTALKRFGNVESLKEDCQASWGVRMWDDLVQDVKYAFRQIAKHKVHTVIIVLTLAICMGSNTSAYNFVVKLVSKPYDYADDERIMMLGKLETRLSDNSVTNISVLQWKFLEENSSSFSDLGFFDDENVYDLDLGGSIRRVSVDEVTSGIWPATGIRPVEGRFFDELEVENSQGKVIVLSEGLWLDLGGGKSNLLGTDLILDGESYRVVGVAPQSFYLGYFHAEAFIPRIFESRELQSGSRNNHSFNAVGKLKPGVTVEQANEDLRTVFEGYMDLYPQDRDNQSRTGATFGGVEVNRFIAQETGQIGGAFKSVQMVTFVVLIIGCLNVGGMILVKGYSRIQELAMRKAMGASVLRLARQIYVEIIAYFLISGLLSFGFLKLIYLGGDYVQLNAIPWAGEWEIDLSSMYLTFAVSLVAALLTGLMPLISILRKELMDFVRSGNRTMAGSASRHRLHGFFVVSQVSLSVVLLVAAGVLVHNLKAVMEKEVGFHREGRLAFEVPQPDYRFAKSEEGYRYEILPFQERVLSRIRSMPGVVSASASSKIPLDYKNSGHSDFGFHHYEYAEGEPRANCLRMVIRPGYFETVGTRLLMGREFEDTDSWESEKVVIISQNTMERYFEGLDPIGMMINFWGEDLKIIGVAEQVQDKPFFIEFDRFTLYFPLKQWRIHDESTVFITHVQGGLDQHRSSITRAILEMDPKLTVESVAFDEVHYGATFAQRVPMVVTLLFASLALFLSGLGLYGLISFTVAERTKEYGIRMALGACHSNILKRVLGGSGKLISYGLAFGLVVSVLICIRINPILADINTINPITFVIVVAFVVIICMFASFFPARRATRIDIAQTLQN